MDPMQYLAHISEDGQRIQTVREHLTGAAQRAAAFGAAFGCGEQAYFAGLLHDIGKYSDAFQRRIRGGKKPVDHSTAGAQEMSRRRQAPAAYAIAGHHSGLPDGGGKSDTAAVPTLQGRMKKEIDPCGAWQDEIDLPPDPPVPEQMRQKRLGQAFYTRMLFSCLVDADFLDTEAFMCETPPPRGGGAGMEELLRRLKARIADWFPPKNELNARRCAILQACLDKGAAAQRGLYSLTVPTGGGKTVSSLAFALSMAAARGMDRVIYVIPYTSIIEQNASVFSDFLGAENVLEHHSSVEYQVDESADPEAYRKALATENWDMPVVVTTAVQFFESLFANRSSRCRKLHSLANSVIIFDEAQNLPLPYLRPCTAAIAQLVQHYRAAAVLCTATQPALQDLFDDLAPGLSIQEICPDLSQQVLAFRRTTLQNLGERGEEEIGSALADTRRVLCVVNRRKTAQELYKTLPREGSYCLTTLLCPAHRARLLAEIRQRLRDGLPCRVVSTSLIEAGVDVDFPAVYREMAGLDSILQAAGRCNREGKRPLEQSPVYIFRLKGQRIPEMIQTNVSATESVLQHFEDPASPEAIEAYFRFLRKLRGSKALDEKGILDGFEHDMEGRVFPFAMAAERFRLIESPAVTVYLPREEGEALIARLREGGRSRSLFRQLGRYGVPVYPDHLKRLQAAGAVQQLDEEVWILTDLRCYDEHTGLTMDVETGAAIMI
ncbi:MAG: CRISPR-associated helicase Cas3' [Oscillospiraceae bacterium]|nr:CRISPR-associated helicase Cas3' [Oscillospiraceae bacterium]